MEQSSLERALSAVAVLDPEGLDRVAEAMHARRAAVAADVVRDVRAGNTVRLASTINPHYLAGLTVKVVKVNPKSVVVDVPDLTDYGRFAGARGVRLPNTLVGEVVRGEEEEEEAVSVNRGAW